MNRFLAKIRATPSSDSESDTDSNAIHPTYHKVPIAATSQYNGSSFLCENRSILSPSSKYDTPTPPLRPNQFVRNINPANRARRKFSVIRERFESPEVKRKVDDKRPRQMITAKSNNDLYENISDEFLMIRNSVREKKERILKCKSVPSIFMEHSQHENNLRPEDKYNANSLKIPALRV